MAPLASTLLLLLLLLSSAAAANLELQALLALKSSLDPSGARLPSWSAGADPCHATSFDGVGCDAHGLVANISLQGKGLSGHLSPAIGALKHLTGLYLHYNSLTGEIPTEISSLTFLSDLYLNVNNLSGQIPPQIGTMKSLQVLQLCYNQLSGSIPTQLGSLKKLSVVALQSNRLTGAIPAGLGELQSLVRLDLSFNRLFGSIPSRLAAPPSLEALDIRNNSLSGSVPPALRRLNEGFQYANNKGLCGLGFESLAECSAADQSRAEPMPEGAAALQARAKPETANVLPESSASIPTKTKSHASAATGTLVVAVAVSAIAIFSFTQYRRRKQRLGSSYEPSDANLGSDLAPLEARRKAGSPLISLEYPNGWDPLAHHDGEVVKSFRFNLEEIESATQHFSPANLIGKGGFSAVYKGFLRDGSVVAVKRMSKSSCKSNEAEFLKGLDTLTLLRHENLVQLRGFCCSKGRGECFLVYEFVPNGSLLSFLDVKDGDGRVLEWSTRVSVIKGIAKGIQYLHSYKVNKPPLVHENISAEKVLLDRNSNPLLSDSGLNRLLTNDTVFSTLKSSAAMGYLAPEYTTTGKLTEKSDIYAFGVLILQILSGKRNPTHPHPIRVEPSRVHELVDPNLHGRFSGSEAARVARVAALCTHECPLERPSMEVVALELGSCSSSSYQSP